MHHYCLKSKLSLAEQKEQERKVLIMANLLDKDFDELMRLADLEFEKEQ